MSFFARSKDQKQLTNDYVFHDEDIEALAVLGETIMQLGKMKPYGVFSYSFYEPQVESDMHFAQKLFEKNGIDVTVWSGRSFLWSTPKTGLRVRFRDNYAGHRTVAFFEEINQKAREICMSGDSDIWYTLRQRLALEGKIK